MLINDISVNQDLQTLSEITSFKGTKEKRTSLHFDSAFFLLYQNLVLYFPQCLNQSAIRCIPVNANRKYKIDAIFKQHQYTIPMFCYIIHCLSQTVRLIPGDAMTCSCIADEHFHRCRSFFPHQRGIPDNC